MANVKINQDGDVIRIVDLDKDDVYEISPKMLIAAMGMLKVLMESDRIK